MRAIGHSTQTSATEANDLRSVPASPRQAVRAFGCAIALLLMLGGCSKQLYGSLNESAANQVVSALRLEGVYADKTSAGERLWNVTVADDQFAQAVQILERRNLPPQPFEGLGQVFKKESLVSTPTEERARLIHAMSQELERSLMEMDDVLVARVHPVILPRDPLNPKRANASASVLIKYRAGVDMSGREGMIRALVSAGVEGLAYDDVRVLMVSAEKRSNPVERSSISGGVPLLFWGILCGVLAALLLAYAALHWRHAIGRAVQTLRDRSSSRRNQETKRSNVKGQGGHA